MVARIRQLRAEGVTVKQTAMIVGVNIRTVEKYQTPENEQKEREREKRRYDKDRQNPEIAARRRIAALARYYRNKNDDPAR